MTRRARAAGLAACVAALLAVGCGPGETLPAVPDVPAATPAERDIVRAVIDAERGTAFRGAKKTVHGEPGKHRETEFRVWHPAGAPTILEWQAGGAPSGRAWSYDDRHAWFDAPDLLLANYRVTVEDDGPPVAWRPTRRVRITGRRPGRPALELLCDAEHGVILWEQFRDAFGRVRLTSAFETVAFGVEAAGSADDPAPPPASEPLEAATKSAEPAFAPLRLAEPPAGFRQVAADGSAAEVVSYWSDGLGAFLIRQSAAPDAAEAGTLRFAERQGRGTLEGVLEGRRVEITGYLGRDALEAIARGLRAR